MAIGIFWRRELAVEAVPARFRLSGRGIAVDSQFLPGLARATMSSYSTEPFVVDSPNVTYTDSAILAEYEYRVTAVDGNRVKPVGEKFLVKTERRVPRLGVLVVGLGGNNGTTLTAGIVANREKIAWHTKEGLRKPDYLGSMTQASTIRLGTGPNGESVYVPLKNLLPMVDPNDLVIGGWDISSLDLAAAMERAKVLDYDLQRRLVPYMKQIRPLPSIYFPDFIAMNQADRADNVLTGTKQQQLEVIRSDIRNFKKTHNLDKAIVVWSANTERYVDVAAGLNDTAENLLRSIRLGEAEVSPSSIFAVASILEGCSYINGSPQNTFVPGVIELAEQNRVFIGGDDFKSGQTKLKSVLVDFLVSAGLKPVSIASYNHLGNNDGMNLSAPEQFRSKEISKSNVVDDMVASNGLLYPERGPDHTVVIKYVPSVGDSKRALDEYTSEIFMGGKNTLVIHNTCEDSLLAAPLILDLVVVCEMLERVSLKRMGEREFERLHPVLSLLGYMLKAPVVPRGTPVVNALFSQRECIANLFRACLGLPAESHMLLEHKLSSLIKLRN